MKKQRVFPLLLAMAIIFSIPGTSIPEAMAQGENGGMFNGNQGGPGGGIRSGPGGGMMSVSNDPEIQAVLDENADKFEQRVFDDPATGISLAYSLFLPEDYDGSSAYPLLMFIPDSSGSGRTARQLVEQYYGAAVWVTEDLPALPIRRPGELRLSSLDAELEPEGTFRHRPAGAVVVGPGLPVEGHPPLAPVSIVEHGGVNAGRMEIYWY